MILEEVNESFFTTLFEFTPVPHGLFMANHEEGRERVATMSERDLTSYYFTSPCTRIK